MFSKIASIAFLFLLLAFPTQLNAQFGYVGADLGFSRLPLKGAGKGNRINRVTATLEASYRPIQNLAIGVALPFNLSSSSTYRLLGSQVWKNSLSGRSAQYKPNMISKLDLQPEFSAFVRLFPDAKSPIFFEGRVSSFLLEQSFSVNRVAVPAEYYSFGQGLKYPAIPGVDDGFSSAKRSLSPGISLGVLSHVGERGFFLVSMDLDFVQFDMPFYSIMVESDLNYSSNTNEFTWLENNTSASTTVYSFRIGGGIRF